MNATGKLMRYTLIGLGLLLALIIIFINRNLASLAEWALPGSGLWTHLGLLALEAFALLWFWRGLFGGRRHLLLMVDGSEPERIRFAEEFARRMKYNPHIRAAGLNPDDPKYFSACLKLLKDKADAEIQQSAKRIFLATALAQNGRIDALIVFFSLCRLVWRVSAIYNQRPHPREIAGIYWAVVSSTFLALSIEELDLLTEISVGFGEAFRSMAPAGITNAVPFAGKALQTFTAATIDGAANCYLALRAGIITRNAYAYRAEQHPVPGRAAVFKEAGSLLLAMSQALVGQVAGAVASNLADLGRFARGKTVEAGSGLIHTVGQGIGNTIGQSVDLAGQGIGLVGRGVSKVGRELGHGAEKVVSGAWNLVRLPYTVLSGGAGKKKAPPPDDSGK